MNNTYNTGINISTLNVNEGGSITINNYPSPYRTVVSNDGQLHIFYSKETFEEYQEELKSQK